MIARVRRVGILGHGRRPGVQRAVARLAATFTRRGCTVRLADELPPPPGRARYPLAALARWCQVLVALGGDGTALRGARALAGRRAALLPLNFGGLGFLTVAEAGDADAAVRAVVGGKWPIARRRLVAATVRRRGRVVRRARAMNDAVVKGAGGYAAIHLRLSALGYDLGHLVADGIVCATATGSTAYSLSAGGPVLVPELEALVVTPACPHTLASRPLVLPPSAVLTLRVLGSSDHAMLLLDGQESVDLAPGDQVDIGLSRARVRVFVSPERPFGRTLHSKLGWQGSSRRSL